MAETAETVRETTAKLTDRVSDAYRKASELAQDACGLTSLAQEVIDGGKQVAGEAIDAVRRRTRDFEHIPEDAAYHVRRAPFWAVGGAVGAGLVFGVVVGWLAFGARRHE
jgi:ElaB/YqjD/DUF883 family membrane-anchored ribosome-binding protein